MVAVGVLSGANPRPLLFSTPVSSLSSTRGFGEFSQVSYPRAESATLINCKLINSPIRSHHGGNTHFPFLHFNVHASCSRSISSFSASANKSGDSFEEDTMNLYPKEKETEKAWRDTLKSFKEQALKMQNLSQEAYELYCQKAAVILKETSEQLKIHAEKAGRDLGLLAKDITEGGKEYIAVATEKSPEPVKDVVETFASSTSQLNDISEVYDFYLGIPYGLILCVGGFLSFMLTGSISAVRFGVILGGALLALSVSSLRLWKSGQSFDLTLKGQAAIAAVLFLREAKVLLEGNTCWSYLTTLLSGSMVGFYLYRIMLVDGAFPDSNNVKEEGAS